MPIRFRCVYCNQLLGISRRKAGTIVRCTTCEGQLIVPDPSDAGTEAGSSQEHGAAPPASPPAKTEGQGGVFDAEDFDAFLEPLNVGGPAVASPPAPSARRAPSAQVQPPATRIESLPPDAALTLTRRGLTIAAAVAVLAVGLAFAGGLLVGLALR
jgi:hypothetical protein